MTKKEALELLKSELPHDRIKASRIILRSANKNDLSVIRLALSREKVSYVQTALQAVIDSISKEPKVIEIDEDGEEEFFGDIPEQVRDKIKSDAKAEVAGLILHELGTTIGLAALTAAREIPEFEASKTKRYLDQAQSILDSVTQLQSATAIPRPEEFDLAELITQVIAEEEQNKSVQVSKQGKRPLVIKSDPGLVRFAVINGLRNAIEAVEEVGSNEAHSVVVAWGETDIDYWVTILDKGAGIVGNINSAFEIGKTTKKSKNHSGFGLSIAKSAMETLGGVITLQASVGGGTRYELRWDKQL